MDDTQEFLDEIWKENEKEGEVVIMEQTKWGLKLRVGKNYNYAEVTFEDCPEHEYQATTERAFARAREVLAVLPDSEDTGKVKAVPKKNYQAQATQVTNKIVTNDDVAQMSRYLKGGQLNIVRQGINKGAITIDDVKGLQNWNDSQALIGKVFDSGVYKKGE